MTQDLKTKLIQEAITKFIGRFGWLYKYMAEAKPLNPAYHTNNHGINMEDFLATEIGNAVDKIVDLINSKDPDLVCPINTPPFREDYINKHKLLSTITQSKEDVK